MHLRIHLLIIYMLVLALPALSFAQTNVPDQAPLEGASVQSDLLEIVISSRGQRVLLPLAVPNAQNLGSTDPEGLATSIAELMRRSFTIAGYFEVYGPDRYFFDANSEGITAGTIRFENWTNVGAQAVIKAGFRINDDQVELDFRLFNVDMESEIDIGWERTTVESGHVNREVYNFINRVILYYSGQLGVFGSRITYVGPDRHGTNQIWTANMDGSSVHQVTENNSINMLPAFGPDGEIMYTSFQAGNPDVWIGDEIFSNREGLNMGASLRPGGEEIAITLSIGGDSEIYILDREGEIIRQCTDNLAEDVSPMWSPGGSRMVFVSDRSGGPQLYIMNADCTNQHRITFAGSYNTTPDWSPDGRLIAFTGRDSRNRFDIFTVEVTTGYITRLTQDQGNNEEPSWSPDSRYLIFQSDRGGRGTRLFIGTADGEFQTVVTEHGNGYQQPSWHR